MATPLPDSLRPGFPMDLSAVAFTDIVDSTGMLDRSGLAVHVQMMRQYESLFRRALARFPGSEVINPTGDGHCAKFRTATECVFSMLWLHRQVQAEPWPGDAVGLRVGIHLGDYAIIPRPDDSRDAVGSTVHAAARITALAGPGETVMSKIVADQARQVITNSKYVWTDLGPRQLRGLGEAINIWRIVETRR